MTGERPPTLVLASASKARAALLYYAGVTIAQDPAGIDEEEVKRTFRAERRDAASCAMALAEAKALRVAARQEDALVLGADQLLECGGTWYDKPRDRAAARVQLLALRDRPHRLVTAAAVVRRGAVIWRHLDQPVLTMRAFGESFLDSYLDAVGDAALASPGAYQVEGLGVQLFSKIEGDYFAILGLPLLPLLDFLREHGVVAA